MSITLESRRDFVENVTKLSFWLSGKYYNKGLSFEEALTKGTPVYRFTTLWNGTNHPTDGFHDEEWSTLLEKLKDIYTNGSIDIFEKEGFELLKPFIEPRYEIDVKAWPWIPSALGSEVAEEKLHGMFLYEITKGKELDLHMGNIYAPESPFKDMKLLATTLYSLLEDVIDNIPNVKYIVCESWMNSFKPFLSLFPPEWCENYTATNMINYTYDVWGQMMNRKGGFHKPNGDYLRSNCKFPYPSVKCGCSIKALQYYLRNTFCL